VPLERITTFQPYTNYNVDDTAADLEACVSENINFPVHPVLQDYSVLHPLKVVFVTVEI
jgi:hypothetical protein